MCSSDLCTSIPDLAKIQYPGIDLSGILTEFWDTAAIIGDMDEPLLILHGADDQLVPLAQGQTIFALAGSTQKWMEALPGVGHQGLWTATALAALDAFLERLQGATLALSRLRLLLLFKNTPAKPTHPLGRQFIGRGREMTRHSQALAPNLISQSI